jgi:L-lactate dehydrogenase complex protein LldE
MCRLLHVQDEPRQLLGMAGCAVSEMVEADRCCGFGGLFSIRMAPVSNAMTAEKLLQAEDTGARLLVTADPGCLMQMRGLAQEEGIRMEHLATLLEALTR